MTDKLDPKKMKVADIKTELERRGDGELIDIPYSVFEFQPLLPIFRILRSQWKWIESRSNNEITGKFC